MRFSIPVFAASITAGALGLALSEHAFAPSVAAQATVTASGPTVALLLTRPGAGYTSLVLARAGESAAPTPVARLDHADAGVVKGTILPGTSVVLAVADTAATRDLSFASSLFRVEPRRPVERLVDGQFCVPSTPSDEVGGASRTLISFDCGYGIGQVTSGMHTGENPGFDRAHVASDPTYNLATGTRILAVKWVATNCVGDNQPTVIEHWYAATWAYNGLAYVNNPSNPNYDSNTRRVGSRERRGRALSREGVRVDGAQPGLVD